MKVIITGASSGIGAALARHYLENGATLGLISRRRGELEKIAAPARYRVEVYAVDVRDSFALQAAAADFIGRHGSPDVVIANAGVSIGTLTELVDDIEPFQEVLDINLTGMVKTFQPFLAAMRESKQGALVGIASVAGYRGLPGAAAYSASKAAVISLLESLRCELSGSGVRVVTICPGYIETSMTAKNPYPMPFIMSAETTACKIAAIIAAGKTYAVIPWQMAIVARLLRILPNWIFDRALGNVGRKPRRGE